MAKKNDFISELTDDWTPLTDDPIVSDVIRWSEPIFAPMKPGQRGKAKAIGQQMVAGEILSLAGEAPLIFVMEAEQLSSVSGSRFKELPVKVGTKIKRRYATILEGDCHRLLWKDEGARDFIISEQK